MSYRLALTGDVIMNTRVSVCADDRVRHAVSLLQAAEMTCAHLEIPLHDFDGSEVFPAAEGALSWMRGPSSIAGELAHLGVDAVSTASNHSLDWSYGGLRATHEALDAAGVAHAGTGADLAAARAPAFADTPAGRLALVSATSSFPTFARAGATRPDAPGRPGVNPQRYLSVVPPDIADELAGTLGRLGLWVLRRDDELLVHPPGLHNSGWRLRVDDTATHPTTVCDPDDLAGNLDSIRLARSVADVVVAQLHVQAWDGVDGRMSSTPAFAREYAHAAVGAGASVVLVQGSHAPVRGIEVHGGVPVLYDPGPLFRLGRREPQPHDFYTRWGNDPAVRSFDATLLDAFAQRERTLDAAAVLSPSEGYRHEPGVVLPVCTLDHEHRVVRLELHPMSWSRAPRSSTGFPIPADGRRAAAVLARLAELSAPYGTEIDVQDGVGVVTCCGAALTAGTGRRRR